MEKLLRVADIAERYGVSDETARHYIRRIPGCMEKPLRVTERQLYAWEAERIIDQRKPETRKRRMGSKKQFTWIPGVSRIPGK